MPFNPQQLSDSGGVAICHIATVARQCLVIITRALQSFCKISFKFLAF